MTPSKRRFVIEAVEAIWEVQVRDEAGTTELLTLPVFPTALKPGRGPGFLVWTKLVDKGIPGLEAQWCSGRFKILAITPSEFALFFEGTGGCKALQVGAVDELKIAATEHKRDYRPPVAPVINHPEPLLNELRSGARRRQNG